MSDPRRQTLSPETRQQADWTRDVVRQELLLCTQRGARKLLCTGVSFVTMGMGVWASELVELDGAATAQLMRALGDMFDPALDSASKDRAEESRQAAVRQLHVALDLLMAQEGGAA